MSTARLRTHVKNDLFCERQRSTWSSRSYFQGWRTLSPPLSLKLKNFLYFLWLFQYTLLLVIKSTEHNSSNTTTHTLTSDKKCINYVIFFITVDWKQGLRVYYCHFPIFLHFRAIIKLWSKIWPNHSLSSAWEVNWTIKLTTQEATEKMGIALKLIEKFIPLFPPKNLQIKKKWSTIMIKNERKVSSEFLSKIDVVIHIHEKGGSKKAHLMNVTFQLGASINCTKLTPASVTQLPLEMTKGLVRPSLKLILAKTMYYY